jgi:hypothetical protein
MTEAIELSKESYLIAIINKSNRKMLFAKQTLHPFTLRKFAAQTHFIETQKVSPASWFYFLNYGIKPT